MTPISNLGFQSEFVISQLEADILVKPEYTVLKTASNPSYYFGNLLALSVPISTHSKEEWLKIFTHEFKDMPKVEHFTFSWVRNNENESAIIESFTSAGFEFEEMHILALNKSAFKEPIKLNQTPVYRALTSQEDWEQWIQLSIADQQGDYSEEGLKTYLTRKAKNYKQLEKAQLGTYLGAFVNNKLIGYAGLYHKDALGRFQNVHVIPEYQNQKIASTLLTLLIQNAPSSLQTLVIVADEHYHATALYQSLGFSIVERECSLCWWPESHRKTAG